jgi:tRNA(Ile)-lysidine synthase
MINHSLSQQFLTIAEQLPSKNIMLAYSGGLDSSVLLHLFSSVKKQLKLNLKAVHVNHQLSANANKWQNFCHIECLKQEIEFFPCEVKVKLKSKKGLESEARAKRYKAITKVTDKNAVICTAHHLDDQIETFFIRLLRGSGIKGLSAIKNLRKQKKHWLARPLLGFSRHDLEQYAKENNIDYIHDESNDETKFDRNYLRHVVMPVINQRYPSYQKTIERSIGHIQNVAYWMDAVASTLYKTIRINKKQINLTPFYAFSTEQQIAVLRYWFDKNKLQQLSTKKLDNLIQQIVTADALSISVDKYLIKKFKNHCYLVENKEYSVPTKPIMWDTRNDKKLKIKLLDITLNVKKLNALGVNTQTNPVIEIRFRKENETVFIDGVGNQPIKKFFQNHSVPPWQRDTTPLIYSYNKLLKVYL